MCVYLHWFIYLLYKGMKNRQDGFSYVSPYDDFFTVISDDNLCKHNTLSGKMYGTPCINTYTYIMLTYHGMFFFLDRLLSGRKSGDWHSDRSRRDRFLEKKTSARIGAWRCNYLSLLEIMIDRQTDRPTDRKTG